MLKKVSKKQAKKNSELQKIKSGKERRCYFCGGYGGELMHILNRSTFPQYYTKEWNLVMGCNLHHSMFDYSIEFRKKYNSLFKQVVENVNIEDIGMVNRYFGKL